MLIYSLMKNTFRKVNTMKKEYLFFLVIIVLLMFDQLYAQQIFINEIMSSNGVTIADEDGDYSDWFELFNNENNEVNLDGYGISDDVNLPFKWTFPQITIPSNEHLLVFASDKNRTDYVQHWETIINWGDDWKYKLGTSEPPSEWKNLNFNDQLWTTGPSGFGYGDGDDSTIVPAVNSVYIRKVFNVSDFNDIKMAVLHVDYDDAFVAYLNGVEIARANIGTIGIPPAYNESATTFTEPLIVYGGKPQRFIINNYQSLLLNGDNVLAIQVHNYGTGSSDLTLIPFLTLGFATTPANPVGIHPLLDLPNKFLHTNFKLSSEGETLVLTSPQSNIIDQVTFGMIPPDMSYGRKPDGTNLWELFPEPTPGDSNLTQGYNGITTEPIVQLNGGFYSSTINVNVDPASAGDIIRYTLDGSEPADTSLIYSSPITINSTKVLRVRSFSTGLLPSKILTNTYFINFNTPLTVVSLSTDPKNLFDEEYGIYALGDSAEPSFPYFGANFWKDWERPVHIELFETDGSKGFGIDMGAKIFGGWSRGNAQKSFALFARGQYGYNILNYKLFDDLPYDEYESFVLRNSGNDWGSTMFRDAFMTSLVESVDIEIQDYRPAVLFINGEYWGIQNIREKVNEHFLAQHHELNPDSLDILEYFGQVVYGDSIEFMQLYNFVENNSMTLPANYEYVKSKVDIENFIRYYLSQIYFDNQDWPGSNIKYWKPKNNGKWRWIMYDTDFGYGIWNSNAYQNNTLNFALEPNGPSWPNPPWSTLFLRKFLDNQSFKTDFINTFADFSNSIFSPNTVLNILNNMASVISPEITRHSARWNQFDLAGWLNNVQVMRTFATNRINNMRAHFQQRFGLSGVSQVNLAISDTSMGRIKLNSLIIKNPTWSGSYFNGIPINIIAVPHPGYKFLKWSGSNNSTQDSLTITLTSAIYLNAIFEVDSNYSSSRIVFNEINYNSALTFNTEDWIELYNDGESDVDLSGWIFKDSDDLHIFSIPQGTVLQKDSFLVICIDTVLFKSLFPDVHNVIGNTGFGLAGSGELIRLYDGQMNMKDSLVYDDAFPWPTSPDGNGPTLSLRNPELDNSLGENWLASAVIGGTPGKINDIFVDVKNEQELIPAEFALNQNYPNPFNPSTIITFQLPVSTSVTLKIFNAIGEEVDVVVNEYLNAGYYSKVFNTNSNLPSGVYFYQLRAGEFTQTKKMILIK